MKNNCPATVYELILASAQKVPKSTAIHYVEDADDLNPGYAQSYEQLLSKLHKSVNMMRTLTGKRRPVVSLLLPNIPQAQTLLWAAESAGVANPLNPLLSEEALFQLMEKAKTDLIFVMGPMEGSDLWGKAERVAGRLTSQPQCVSVLSAAGSLHYDALVNRYADIPLGADAAPSPGDIAAYYHTGGTTGTPKLACHTHANQTAGALAVVQSMQLTESDIAINGLPIFHVAGAIVNSLAILAAGGQLVLPTAAGFRNPSVIRNHWRLIQHLGVTISSGIPTSMASMLDTPVEHNDIGTLRFLVSGGAPVPLKLHELAQQKLGRHLYQAYGMTECSGVIALPNLSKPPVWGSVGQVAAPSEVRIDSGEICIRSPMVSPGYLGSEKQLCEDGWFRTGDLGRVDEEGNLFITGRAKDLIIRSGHNIDPGLIEGSLEQHPAVGMAAAVGMPDKYAGELPVAFVQLRAGAHATCEELQEFAMTHIDERPACPKRIVVLDTLPITAVGKVFKPKLREHITELLLEELIEPHVGKVTISTRHTESGELVVRLTDVPSTQEAWCRSVVAQLNLQLEALITQHDV
ncbi:AMP-binding protein [Pseudomonas stutzeri]|uniref:AMP-binding protein n=1 Tax=Stutzerimonas stutzeri TaxID=316 RepID=A0A2N8S7V3_STUST|nr:AMP-binding protein [Stutzerimonas stutzeri]MCQ4295023.1 AMP-binding protein [Stutzerimonas stutzeri]PNF82701.1 AMP-binding protein [Stutzerimonas stutzeri]